METDLPTEEITSGEQESNFDVKHVIFGTLFQPSEETTFDLQHLMKASRRCDVPLGNNSEIADMIQESDPTLKSERPSSCDMISSAPSKRETTHKNRPSTFCTVYPVRPLR